MTGFGRGVVLGAMYATWTRELARHWPDGARCVCGAPISPCDAEVTAMRWVRRVDAEWRVEGARVVALQAAAPADTSGAPGGAAQHDNRPAPSNPRRWT